jgi:DNA (cytosine-5)-methyltransferase 1
VERVIIENVPEFLSWGPLDATGHPIQNQKGKTFRAFISSLRSLGYTVDWKKLCAADYVDPTTRRRLFIQAAKGRKRILWPQITHMDGPENLMGYQPWRPARDIIDWSIPGTSIFDRKKPLADATIRRIAEGIEKYWKDYANPFLEVLYGYSDVRNLDLPLPTITASGHHHALIEPLPLLLGQQSGAAARPADQPVPTVATAGAISLIEPFITAIGQNSAVDRSRSIDEPLSTVVGKQEHCLIEPFITRYQGSHLVEPLLVEYHGTSTPYPVSLPVKTITTKDRFALLEPVKHGLDIRFRMLKNHELKKAQGFPDDYVITGNTTEQTKQIGNAVPVNTAKALALAAMGV